MGSPRLGSPFGLAVGDSLVVIPQHRGKLYGRRTCEREREISDVVGQEAGEIQV